ncbi:l-serine ammonia-lyase [Reticulomyxa filosa]|uniref:L-serine ammonia-lyase n=1 Tax=Reticulomyxa filosa TaxID=46433 RepID=X6LN29_RETFI|nr:l-serine ammonia-lyase [Reticulomyxa filosa]|eukprot:ETO03004.1 l-serine ammonia-lyase [Reticulomyxa filosa]
MKTALVPEKGFSPLHVRTPLLRSSPLSKLLNRNVYLKLDSFQRSGSFKDRGMSVLLQHYKNNGIKKVISSSGGNAGIACATIANQLNMACHVIVPKTTAAISIAKMQLQNANVTIHGNNWNDSDEHARGIVEKNKGEYSYVHPFDHPLLWKGHSTVIHEISEQWKQDFGFSSPPDAIICSVGGGGLLNGICLGMNELGWGGSTSIITAETIGCESFYQSFIQKKLVTLESITSIATTLGARQIQKDCLTFVQDKHCVPLTVTDAQTIEAIGLFLNDHKILVEPACAASLALVYQQHPVFQQFQHIVIEVCGGSGIDLQLLQNKVEMVKRLLSIITYKAAGFIIDLIISFFLSLFTFYAEDIMDEKKIITELKHILHITFALGKKTAFFYLIKKRDTNEIEQRIHTKNHEEYLMNHELQEREKRNEYLLVSLRKLFCHRKKVSSLL